jgi:hypothetical protein
MKKHYDLKPKRSVDYWKPAKFKNYLTISELAYYVRRDPSVLRRAEKSGRIFTAARVRRGQLTIRLYSPQQAEELRRYFEDGKKAKSKKRK